MSYRTTINLLHLLRTCYSDACRLEEIARLRGLPHLGDKWLLVQAETLLEIERIQEHLWWSEFVELFKE